MRRSKTIGESWELQSSYYTENKKEAVILSKFHLKVKRSEESPRIVWLSYFGSVGFGEFIVMPNHVHGVIEIIPIYIERYNISLSNRNAGYHYEPNPGDINSTEQDEADQHDVEMMHASSLQKIIHTQWAAE